MAEGSRALSESEKQMILNVVKKRKKEEEEEEMFGKPQKVPFLSEEEEGDEEKKKKKEREIYLEMRQKAIANPLTGVPFFPFGPGSNFNPAEFLSRKVVLPPGFKPSCGIEVKLPSRPSSRGCESVPFTPELVREYEKQRQVLAIYSPNRKEKGEKSAATEEGRCLDGSYLTPYCNCASRSQHCGLEFSPILLPHKPPIRHYQCFDVELLPGSAPLMPLLPSRDFNGKVGLLMELANRAILEYNEKEFNVCKYKVLKIEKVNQSVTAYYQYWMTVKVLNLTLGTPIETFQIHAGHRNVDDKVIYCCLPKEEAIVGLPSCDVCSGKLRREESSYLNFGMFEATLF